MIILQGHARFASGTLDDYRAAMATMIAETRAEDGCELYAFAVDVLDPDLLHITERWRDADALKAHGESAHMAAFQQTIAAAAPQELSVLAFTAEPRPR